MFDTYRIQQGPSHVTTTVAEKRAPTDESVRLLREMEDAAKKEVIKAIRLDGNTFKGVIQQCEDQFSGQYRYRVVFDLNGTRHEVEMAREVWEEMDDFVPKLRDAIAARIAATILISVTTDSSQR